MELTINFEEMQFFDDLPTNEGNLMRVTDAAAFGDVSQESSNVINCFEDNFVENSQQLPDSQQYLQTLERKLQKVRKDNGVLSQFKQKREECLQHLLNGVERLNNDYDLELESQANEIVDNGVVLEILRQVRPQQPLSIGETVHIIEHDLLQRNTEGDDDPQDEVEK